MNNAEAVRQVLQDLGYTLSDRGREYRTKPLYRDSDNDNVLRIWKNSGQWVDFKESVSGSLEDLIKLTLKLKTIDEAKQWIVSRGIDASSIEEDKPKAIVTQPTIFDPEILLKLRKDDAYWHNRKISSSTLEPLKGGVATSGKMFNRYVFPIFNSENLLIGFSGRDVSALTLDGRPKWKHLGDKKEWVFPAQINSKALKAKKEVILVESIGDMLALMENDISNVLVSFGLHLSNKMLYTLIALNPKKIVVAFNNDGSDLGAGNSAAETAQNKLLSYFDKDQIAIKLPQTAKDFGEMHLKNSSLVREWYKGIHD
jgi:hypothetical protein